MDRTAESSDCTVEELPAGLTRDPLSVDADPSDGGNDGVNKIIFVLTPLALLVLLVMRHWGFIAPEPLWVYGAIFGIAAVISIFIELHAVPDPSPLRLNVQIGFAAATTTAIAYVTGWGPVMIAGYATAAAMTIARNGSRTWRLCMFWNVAGIAAGQLAISLHWAPSKLSIGDSYAIAVLACIGFVAMIRIVALEAVQKERVEERMSTSEERFRSLVAHSSDMILLLNEKGTEIRYASPGSVSLLGIDSETLVGRNPESIVHPDDLDLATVGLGDAFDSRAVVRTEFRVVGSDGVARDVDCVISDLRSNPAVSGFVLNLRDITDRQRLRRDLEHRVRHDVLTDLPNRQFVFDRLEECLSRNRRESDMGPVLMFLDLDRFKEVNDQFGHAVGDRLLVQFGQRLLSTLRQSDLLARLGGDEFVILCDGLRDTEAALRCADRALEAVEQPFEVEGHSCSVGLSIGIAMLNRTVTASDALMQADLAMYQAKRRGDAPHVHLLNCAENSELVNDAAIRAV